MQKRISLLLVIVMIVTSLLACGKEKLNTKNESYEGKTGGFYTKQAIENWNSYDEADCTNIEAENIRLSGKKVSNYPITVTRKEKLKLRVTPPESADYCVVAEYRPVGDVLATDALYEVKLNGKETKRTQLQMLWHDLTREAVDRSGNESVRRQTNLDEYVKSTFLDYGNTDREKVQWKLEKGKTYTFEIIPDEQGIEISGLMLYKIKDTKTEKMQKTDNVPMIVIEAEKYSLKSDSYIRATSARDASLSPYDTYHKKINLIDSSAWGTAGQKIIWEFEAKEEGNYHLGLHLKQNADVNKTVFRTIEIDGKVTDSRWENAKVPYTGTSGYHNYTFNDEEGDMTVHLAKGKHTLAMVVTVGDYKEIYSQIDELMKNVNQLGTELLRITGGVSDENRTWDLESYMPDATDRIKKYAEQADKIYEQLEKIDGKEPVYAMDLQTASDKLRKLLEEPEKIPGKTEDIFRGDDSASKYLGNVLSCLTGQGLSLDKIYLYGTDELPKEDISIFKTAGEAIKRFLWSFTDEADSDNYAASDQNEEELEVWVAQSTVTVQILQQLLDETYNKEHNTNIRLKVMPNEQKLVLSNATNTNPDVVLCATAGQPFTFACRGALKNLLDYEDFMDVYTKDYQLESLVATSYGDGVYGAVDSRNFQLLFYRKDILESLHLEVPQTWDDIEAMMPTLLRNQMNCYIPISQRASLKSLGVTTPFIYQKGAEIYSEKGNTTAINSTESVDAITKMTEFYKIYGMQTTVENFYLSFRYGEVPIGIGDFNTYLQLKMAAPELAGQWGVALCPGTRQKDGSILRYQPADTTASMIFANTDKPDEAWEFLKWWLDEDTQYEYSIRRCQSLGLEYQWNTANIEAFKKLPFDSDVKEKAIEQWQYQREVTPHPASYIVERELSGVWNDVVIDSSDMMESLDQAVLVIDREIKRKLQEFGYIDQDGKLIKDYNIEILKMLYTKTGRRGAKNEK